MDILENTFCVWYYNTWTYLNTNYYLFIHACKKVSKSSREKKGRESEMHGSVINYEMSTRTASMCVLATLFYPISSSFSLGGWLTACHLLSFLACFLFYFFSPFLPRSSILTFTYVCIRSVCTYKLWIFLFILQPKIL